MDCPVPPAMIAVPVASPGSEGPCPRPEVTFQSLTDVEGAWIFFPWRKKSDFPEWENCALWATFPLLRAGSAACSKEGKDSTLGTSVQGSGHLPGAADTAAASRTEAGRSRSQNCALESREHPMRETKNKTNSTEKVERLRDNRRGLRVVIYNRDCKMVNQIWS